MSFYDTEFDTELVGAGRPKPALRLPKRPYARYGKRSLDVVLVLVSLPVVLVIVGLIALILIGQGGAPFYSQLRVGRKGRHYRIWKLRTMVSDADARLEAYLASDPEARREWNALQKLRRDPRITRFGHVLRKCSLDELPQLWNVLKGDMSLVGPRPMMVNQEPLYPGRAYFRMRPGITGFWQISDRNNSTFAERAKFDTMYARNLSLGTDLRVLLSTVRVMLKCTGC